jgi:hypothetical protein
MIEKNLFRLITTILIVIVAGFTSCSKRDVNVLGPATFPTNGDVFLDGFSAGLNYQAFSNSKVDAFDVDDVETYAGERSMKITVPSEGDPSGWYAGGAFIANPPRDLTGYNALTFWGKASMVATVGLVGFGNDNTGNSRFGASLADLTFSTAWEKYIIPIPNADKLVQEQGMFQFAAGANADGAGYYLWFDQVQFEKLGTIAHPKPVISTQIISAAVGDTINVGDITVVFDVNGVTQKVTAMPGYLNYVADNDSVVAIENGLIKVIGDGTTVITGTLGDVDADGAITVTVGTSGGVAGPAPTPAVPESDVISLFSNAYTNITVDTWSAEWDEADVTDVQISGDDVKLYTNLNFAGIEFTSQTIDATAMTHIHMDIWTPDPTAAPAAFKIKLIDFGANGIFDGGDDVEHEIALTEATLPAIASERWVSLDIPLSDFIGLTTRGHLAQLILSGDPNTVYVDNIYFYNGGGDTPTTPTQPAPMPTEDQANVISLFSNAYTNAAVDTWSAEWDETDVEDAQVGGDDVKLYTNLNFAGIEFTSQTLDVSGMTHFHMDIWTPGPTASPAVFKIKLVDFGANGVFDGGPDDVEGELVFDAGSNPSLTSSRWVSFDIPLTNFAGLTTKSHMAQLILTSDPNIVYVDNIYFYSGGGGSVTSPEQAAPTPAFAASDVISLFSDAYPDVTVDTWSAEWDEADVADTQIAGDNVKLYTNVNFAGIEFTSQTIDATAMTHFYMNIWTPNPTAEPAVFKIKLVDFGANGIYDESGDDVEHELEFTAASTPALVTGNWIIFDIPLTEFTGLTTKAHLAQLIFVSTPNTVYVDNILLHK